MIYTCNSWMHSSIFALQHIYPVAYLPRVVCPHHSGIIVRATPLGAGFVDIFIGQIRSESDDQIQ